MASDQVAWKRLTLVAIRTSRASLASNDVLEEQERTQKANNDML